MALRPSACLLLALSLAAAAPRPSGSGARSAAAAKAEARAGSGSLGPPPLPPLTVAGGPGFSGSFSKSSSSSFASSSASSSSSSFSYNGAGAGLVGFGTNAGCGGDCHSGGRNDFGPSAPGFNNNGGSGGRSFAGASASAGAIANVPVAVSRPCGGADCFGESGKQCPSGQCGRADLHAGGAGAASTGNSNSASTGDESNNYDINISEQNEADKKINDGTEASYGFKRTPPVVPFDKMNGGDDGAADCGGQNCAGFVPLAPHASTDADVNSRPSSSETQYREKACATHDCHLASSNGRRPSSYNVPILGNPQQTPEKENPICTSSECQNVLDDDDKNPLTVNAPSTTLQLPLGPAAEQAGAPCESKDCYHPSYPLGSSNPDAPFSNSAGADASPSHDANGPSPAPGVFRPMGSPGPFIPGTGSNVNPSYSSGASRLDDLPSGSKSVYPHSGPGSFGNNPTFPPTGYRGPNHHPSVQHDIPSSLNDPYIGSYRSVYTSQKPTSQPSSVSFGASRSEPPGPAGSFGLSQNGPHTEQRPSDSGISSDVLSGSDTDLICAFGSCVEPNLKPLLAAQSPTGAHALGCPTAACQDSFGSDGGYGNAPIAAPGETSNPSKAASEVLSSNKGNEIYSGGFGGPLGIFSANNNDKPSSGISLTPHPAEGQVTPSSDPPLQPSNGADFISSPIPSRKPLAPGQHPLNTNYANDAGAAAANAGNAHVDANKRPYAGGFGGPAGLLAPNEFHIPPSAPKVGPPSDHVVSSASGGAGAAAVASAKAASFSGTFGGPPGLLKPYDDGRLGQTRNYVSGKHWNGAGDPLSTDRGASRAGAVASASSSAGHGPAGACSTGCASGGSAVHLGGAGLASASASAGSGAARGAASAGAHASAAAFA